ncbi:MAG: ADP-glyceromanno-heptose 6-epimerase [Alphaproteobacteria bacterium]
MILVTGGAGFIGSNLVAALDARGSEVAVCDRLGSGEKWRNLAKRRLAALVAPEALLHFLESQRGRLEAIFHLGAISATTERDADLIVASNFTLSQQLWEWSAEHAARFIYASSAAAYGDGSAGFDDDAGAEALARLKPMNPYGWSKLLFDKWAARRASEGRRTPPQWVGLRFFNVYGPNEYHKGDMRSVVKQVHERAAAGEPARLFRSHDPHYPDGGQQRDFIWVGDCVDAMTWLYDNGAVNGLFNLGTGKARSFADLARAVFSALERAPQLSYVDTPADIRERYQYFTEAAMGRLARAGYARPFTALEDGVRRYVKDYLAAPDPYL